MNKKDEWTKEEIEEFEKKVEEDVEFVSIEKKGNYNIIVFDNEEDTEIIDEEIGLSNFQNRGIAVKIFDKYFELKEIDIDAD